jgi:hypothetical protein
VEFNGHNAQLVEQSPQKQSVDSAAETNATIDLDHRNNGVEPGEEFWIGVDIDKLWPQPMFNQKRLRLMAQMAAHASVKNHMPVGNRSPRSIQARYCRPSEIRHFSTGPGCENLAGSAETAGISAKNMGAGSLGRTNAGIFCRVMVS